MGIKAECTAEEITRILAADARVDPDEIHSWVMVLSIKNGDGTVHPAVRSSDGLIQNLNTIETLIAGLRACIHEGAGLPDA